MAVSGLLHNYSIPGYGQPDKTQPPTATPAICKARCDADPECQAWTYSPGLPRGLPPCTNNRVDVARYCPLYQPQVCQSEGCTVAGYKNVTQLEGCVADTSYLQCSVTYTPPTNESAPYYEVPVKCGGATDTLRILRSEKSLELRIFSDWSFVEAFFQRGRVAITTHSVLPQLAGNRGPGLNDTADWALKSTADITASDVHIYPMQDIWAKPDKIRAAPRVYPK
jgi:hypothetical protein